MAAIVINTRLITKSGTDYWVKTYLRLAKTLITVVLLWIFKVDNMKKVAALCVLLGASLLAGCSKLTLANYDLLKLGMSQAEIEAIVGQPDNCSETLGTQTCYWGEKQGKHIKVSFIADKATIFSHEGLK